jgi:phenylalanyl-tRNA synthetase beta chain
MAHRPTADRLEIEVPGYRVDVEREVDLIEEVARVLGYDRLGSHVPPTGQAGGVPDPYAFRDRIRDALVRAGLREVRLLSFASEDDLTLAGDRDAVPMANPLQAAEGWLRPRLLPGLARAVARNQDRGVREILLFETGAVFRLRDDGVDERHLVSVAMSGPAGEDWSAERRVLDSLDAKGVLEALLAELGVDEWSLGESPGEPFHPGRSASVLVGGEPAGVVGELHPRAARAVGIDGRVAVAELDVDTLRRATRKEFVFRDVPRFPPVRRDLAFGVADDVPAGAVQTTIEDVAGGLLGRCLLFDVFRGPPLPEGTKSLAFTLELRASDRTLTTEESEPVVARIIERVRAEHGAELRAGRASAGWLPSDRCR